MEFHDRLEHFIESQGISMNAFEKSIGTRGTISSSIKARSSLGTDWIIKICETYRALNIKWLFTGDGDMEIPENGRITDLEIVRIIFNNKDRFWKIKSFRLLVESYFMDVQIEKELGNSSN